MSEQYYTKNPQSASRPVECKIKYRGKEMTFTTDGGVFSRGELDTGTQILLDALPEKMDGRVLDLGCGWGAVGVSIGCTSQNAQIVMSDVNERALGLAKKNADNNHVSAQVIESDGLEKVEGLFDYIITNPPIRTGKQVIYRLFAESAAQLTENGALYIVIRKQQGAESAIKYLNTLFASVEVIEKKSGFWIIVCKRSDTNEV